VKLFTPKSIKPRGIRR